MVCCCLATSLSMSTTVRFAWARWMRSRCWRLSASGVWNRLPRSTKSSGERSTVSKSPGRVQQSRPGAVATISARRLHAGRWLPPGGTRCFPVPNRGADPVLAHFLEGNCRCTPGNSPAGIARPATRCSRTSHRHPCRKLPAAHCLDPAEMARSRSGQTWRVWPQEYRRLRTQRLVSYNHLRNTPTQSRLQAEDVVSVWIIGLDGRSGMQALRCARSTHAPFASIPVRSRIGLIRGFQGSASGRSSPA